MNNTDKKFSSTLPKNCPLPSSTERDQTVFMAFQSLPITKEQCESQAERGRAARAKGDGACTRHGLSVFPSIEGCQHQLKLFPHLGQHIGAADLNANCGVLAETPSGNNPMHMTWWSYEKVDRASLFDIVESGN